MEAESLRKRGVGSGCERRMNSGGLVRPKKKVAVLWQLAQRGRMMAAEFLAGILWMAPKNRRAASAGGDGKFRCFGPLLASSVGQDRGG